MSGSFNTPGVPVARKAAGAIAAFRILAATSNDEEVAQATGPTDKVCGVSGSVAAVDGETTSLYIDGIVPVEYGGAVTPGDPLAPDEEGRAVVATGGQRIVGFAGEGGDEGTIGSVQVAPGYMPHDADSIADLLAD